MTVVAAFDVDGTLTTRDCVLPYLALVRGRLGLATDLVRATPRLASPLVRQDRSGLRAVVNQRMLGGRALADLVRVGEGFAERVARERLRDDTCRRLRWHLEQGHEVVLVSASYELYLRRLAELIGARAALGTRVAVVDGTTTGGLDGPNCRGPEKVVRLHRWLASHHHGREQVELWAYGDSSGDAELLADADHAVWVRRPIPPEPVQVLR